ncbi:unnamed protein product [Dovyalis caffra]|uniref:Uncharacterized protein n=1 Tax=Dovyalis caffra TaxID=77055 RepID=A0AAV1R4I4_9ROSI|nr:unnamed protein product [Dovyalis caffra]
MKELTAKGKDGVLSVKKNQIDCEGTGPSPQGQIPDTEGEAPLKAGSITRA